jgi:hypothetical protein
MRRYLQRPSVVLKSILIGGMLCSIAWGQASSAPAGGAQPASQQSMPGMDMPGHDMSNMQMQTKDMPMGSDDKDGSDARAHAMNAMEGHMDMGPHMKMTDQRAPKPDDSARAQQIVEAARKASEKYMDYHVALADGFRIFLPRVPQKMYHFTNYRYGRESFEHFNPEHPTSLLYEKHGDDYKLVGVMYTAPKSFTEDELDARIPLSVARWHEHVNFCVPPFGKWRDSMGANPQFGFRGSIATQQACDAAGGTFHPVVLDWMVHVYPFEKDPANIWSVERQHGDAD